MKKINISEYKGSRIYFYFFDIYLKINDIRKEEIFAELFINNSSYRRSRDYEQKVGENIIKQLSDHFGFIIPETSLVETVVLLSHKSNNSKVNVNLNFDNEKGKKLIKKVVEDVDSRKEPE